MQYVWRNKGNTTLCECINFSCAVSLLVIIATFSWPSFVTWLREGYLIGNNSLKSFTTE